MPPLIFLLLVAQMRIGPYLSWDDSTTTTIRINWRTYSADSSVLAYGVDSLTDTLKDNSMTTIHSFRLTGLTPGTSYNYQILGSGYSTPVYTFRTAPEGADSIVFVVYGDTRSDSAAHQMVVNAIMESNPQFVINTGDLVYNGGNLGEWYTFFNIEKELLHEAPLMPCLGNHDYPPDNYFSLFYLPENEEYYSFEYGNVFFVALNTEAWDYSAQRTYLDEKLSEAEQDPSKWLIVYFHRPPYSMGGHGSDLDVRSAFCDVLEQHHVPVVFNGHNHFYQRTEPINGVTYIVSGGGGAPLYQPGSASWIAYGEGCYHYVRIVATATELSMKAIRATDGAVIDSLVIYPTGVEEKIDWDVSKKELCRGLGIFDIAGRFVGPDLSALRKTGVYFLRERGKRPRKIFLIR